ncbi:MAG: hypothetical protein H6Q76_868 [Firmicutes bacterium]|nr:hypothetical protein [Bacillota bacterium]
MFKSMTGFGRGEYQDSDHRFIVEIRSVNHRFNEIVIRVPKNLGGVEDRIRKSIAGTLARGRIDIVITADDFMERRRTIRVDKGLANGYYLAVKDVAETCGLDIRAVSAYDMAKFPDVLKVEEMTEDLETLWPKLSDAINQALANLMAMRTAEGENIYRDLTARIGRIRELGSAIALRAPAIVEEYRVKLRERCREILSEVNAAPDEVRLLQEVAIMADRTNITEELVRLESHLDQFGNAMRGENAVGRKLDFILQELNRETNTIGSKSNDISTSGLMVELKSEIEKVREQIQNIE